MASSKNLFILLALLFALALLVSSQVAASDESMETKSAGEVVSGGPDAYGHWGYGGGRRPGSGCRYGCCGYRGRCIRCCASADEAPDAEFDDNIKN